MLQSPTRRLAVAVLGLSLTVATGTVATARVGPLGDGGRSAAADGPRAVQRQSTACGATVDKTSAPPEITLGKTVTITLKVDGTCPVKEQAADVILAIDRSRSMDNENKIEAAKQAAIAFVNRVDPAHVRIGLVTFSGTGDRILELTSDRAALIKAINDLTTEPGTNLVDGLDAARRALSGANVRPGVNKVVIFMTDGRHRGPPPESDIDPVIAATRAANIEVFTIGLGSDLDPNMLRRIASSPANYFPSPTNAELEGIYLQIAGRIQAQVLFRTSTITDVLPGNMTYVAGSGRPVEPTVSRDGKTLTWQVDAVKEPGYTLTYQVRPQETGSWPTNASARIDFVDGFGTASQRTFPVPTVRVVAPSGPARCVCRIVLQRVPQHVIEDALAHPERYYGWRYPLDPNKPRSPANPPRECLTLMNVNIDYHPLWNTPEWRVGCP